MYNFSNKFSISPLGRLDLNTIITKFNIGSERINTIYPFEKINLASHLDDISLSQYLYSNSISTNARAIIENAVRYTWGLESSNLNALYALTYGKAGNSITKENLNKDKKIADGAQQLCFKLLEHVLDLKPSKIIMNQEVIEINQEFTSLCQVTVRNTLTDLKEKYYCKKVITSIPVNQYKNIKFEPQLPALKSNLFKYMQFGNYTKFIITYSNAFWMKKGFNGEVISDGSIISQPENFSFFLARKCPKISPITCLFDATTNKNHPALMVVSAAKMATAWSDVDKEHRKSEIIESIVRYFNAPEARDYIDYYEKNWSNEFLIGGGPTLNVTSFGCMEEYTRGLREPFLSVHFAGAESASEWIGSMEGAIQSGERCALECMHSIDDDLSHLEYEKTFYYQKQKIESILDANERSTIKISLSLMSKYLLLFLFISIVLYFAIYLLAF